jgi:hypothetical protein
MTRDSRSVIGVKHFKANRWPTPSFDQRVQQPGLQPMMVRIVMFLAKHHKLAVDETRYQRLGVDELRRRNIPDLPDKRMCPL